MKLSLPATIFLFATTLSVHSPIAMADSKAPEYMVKTFKLLTDEAVSDALTGFSQKNDLEIISCNINKADLVCVFKKRS
jgi:hypothetical protein